MPYAVTKEDQNGFEILDTATGAIQYVARAGLSPQMQAQFSSQIQAPAMAPTTPPQPGVVDKLWGATKDMASSVWNPNQATQVATSPESIEAPVIPMGTGGPAMSTPPPQRDWMAYTPSPAVPNVKFDGQPDLAADRNELQTMHNNMKTIYGEAAKNEANFQNKKAEIIGKEQEQIRTHTEMVVENEKRRQEEFNKFYGDAQKDVSEIGKGIDPGRYWSTKNAPNKIVAALAMALGAVGSAFTRSRGNIAIDLIQDQMNKDIDAQKEELANKRSQAGAKMNMLGQLREKYQDERIAENVLRQGYIDQTMMSLDKLTAQSASEQATAKGAEAFEKLRQEKMKLQLQFDAMAIERAKLGLASGAKDVSARTIPGVGTARTEDEAKKVTEMKTTYDTVVGGIDRLLKMRGDEGATVPVFEGGKRTTAETLATSLKLEMKNLAQLGVLSASDLELLQNMIPDQPLGVGFKATRLEEAKKYIVDKANNFFKNRIIDYRGISNPKDLAAE